MALRKLVLLLLTAPLSQPSFAHHSRAEFTGDVIELSGELIEVIWSNPHPVFRIHLDDGSATVWEIQAFGSIGTLTQTGVQSDMFVTGEQVTFAGRTSSRRQLLLGLSSLLPDGTEAILQYNGQPRWEGRRVGGSGSVVIDQAVLDRAAAENRGFFRTWSVESTEIAVSHIIAARPTWRYMDAALAARSNWDLTDNPITRCEPSWMPHTMVQPVDMEIIDNGTTLSLNNFYYSSERTIYMDGAPDPSTQPLSRLGFSRGRWENPATLVVETDRITAPAFDSSGVFQSEQMHVVERFSLSTDQSRLDYRMVMTDPEALSEPAVFESYYLALDRERSDGEGGANCD